VFYSTLDILPIKYTGDQLFDDFKKLRSEGDSAFYAIIGNDCWIAPDVLILEGVTIGDGAIIGAGAIVTKDIPPYAIAVGVPARVIRYRFSEEDIAFLLELKWWDKPESWIRQAAPYFENISRLRSFCDK
jgi:carbonic anhydrase/acetyltransferase-like protein (isoleucine patch superfamily)